MIKNTESQWSFGPEFRQKMRKEVQIIKQIKKNRSVAILYMRRVPSGLSKYIMNYARDVVDGKIKSCKKN